MREGSHGDIDIATDATPSQIAGLFRRVMHVGEHFGVMIVIIDEMQFEVATFRSDIGIGDGRHPQSVAFSSPPEDAQRRDFTINGLFYDPATGQTIDYVNGVADIYGKVIRAIGQPALRFKEDYLRLLRAVRFAARFNFSIDPATWAALCESVGGIDSISNERVFMEINKMIIGKNPHIAIRLLHESGLLAKVLPEVATMHGVEQPPQFHPEGDCLQHTLLALSLMNEPSQVLAWSTLLHDIGKPRTMTISDRIRFNNHHRVGATMAERLLRRLKASNSLIEDVCASIDNHMNFSNVTKMRLSTLKKLYARPTFSDELELHRVDCQASHGDISNCTFLIERQSGFTAEQLKPDPFVGGKDLIARGLKPGPLFGFILEQAYDEQLEERVADREAGLAWLGENLERLTGEFVKQGEKKLVEQKL